MSLVPPYVCLRCFSISTCVRARENVSLVLWKRSKDISTVDAMGLGLLLVNERVPSDSVRMSSLCPRDIR